MQGSRVLRGVIATLVSVGAVSAEAEAGESYCTADGLHCVVYGNDPDNDTDRVVVVGDPGDEDDPAHDGPNWIGGDSTSVDPNCQDAGCDELRDSDHAVCEFLAAEAPPGCDITNPPKIVVNGCGSSGSEFVPDSLIVPWHVEHPLLPGPPFTSAPFGPIFALACDNHDRCYGKFGKSKAVCDNTLGEDMVNQAMRIMTLKERRKYMQYVQAQAWAYATGLQHPIIEMAFSRSAYNSAQEAARCRHLNQRFTANGCAE